MLRLSLFLVCILPLATHAHSGHHDQEPLGEQTDWATRHMAGSCFLSLFCSFFSSPLHPTSKPSSAVPKTSAHPLLTEEHHISNFDPGSFFLLHDYDGSLTWTAAEISRTYGLDDESAKEVPEQKRQEVVKGVMEKFDLDGDGVVSREEWNEGWEKGMRLPDFGVS